MVVNKKDAAAGLASAVALISGAQVANAADPEVGTDWSGIYAGVAVGVMDGDAPMQMNDYQLSNDVVLGGFIGLNHQLDNGLVVGAELALSVPTGNAGEGGSASDPDDYEIGPIADAKFKLGSDFGGGDLLVYGFAGISGGWGLTNYDQSADYSWFGGNFGLGADWRLTESVSLGAEVIARVPVDAYGWTSDPNPDPFYAGSLRLSFQF